MENLCILCGEPLNEDGKCPKHSFKKMCLNCTFCSKNDDGTCICTNLENQKKAIEKIKAAAESASGGYTITSLQIDLQPIPLKKPTCSCGEWSLTLEMENYIASLFS